jgi:hypothetical protein
MPSAMSALNRHLPMVALVDCVRLGSHSELGL